MNQPSWLTRRSSPVCADITMTLLSFLPDIAVQLVAHFLPLPQILQLARCCKRLQSSLDSPFTFKHCPPLFLVYSSDRLCNFSGPLRHARMAVYWLLHSSAIEASPHDVQGLLDSNACIHSLDASYCQHVPVPLLISLLSGSRIKTSLRELILQRGHMPSSTNVDLIRTVCAMPHLQSLTLGHCCGPLKDWSSIPAPPSLTSLTFFPGNSAMFALPFLRAPSLKHLHLKKAGLAPVLPEGSSSPINLCSILRGLPIETLVIDDCHDPLSLPLLLASLSSLTTLHLRRCAFVDSIVGACVRSCASLRTLIIEPGYRISEWRDTRRRMDPLHWDSNARFHVLNEFPLLQVIIRWRPCNKNADQALAVAAHVWREQQGLNDQKQIRFDSSVPVLPRSEPRVGKAPRYDKRFPRQVAPRTNKAQDQQSPLLRSSDDALRLVMQRLDAKSLLCFARCSHRTYYLSDAPFVWRNSPLHLTALRFTCMRQSRLVRHIPLHLSWSKHETFAYYGAIEHTLCRHPLMNLVSVNQVGCRGMNTFNGEWDRKRQWTRFLSQPAVQRLQQLHTDEESDLYLLRMMRGLPCLTQLKLKLAHDSLREERLRYLRSFPMLQSLCVEPSCGWSHRCFCDLDRTLRTTQPDRFTRG